MILNISTSMRPKQKSAPYWKNQHTRLVVTGEDELEELLGVVHVIDLLQQSLRGEPLDLRVLIRQPLVFPETLPLLPALEQFRNARTHFAFVADEFGSVEGIVTLSDVMETIAGNLPNEVEEIDARHDIQKTPMVRGPLTDICHWKTWCSTCLSR